MMAADTQAHPELSQELLDAIRLFPVIKRVEHCGQEFTTPSLEIYTTCPLCGNRLKVRAYAGAIEIEDVFDAVLAWLNQPQAQEAAHRRQIALADDD